MNLIDIFYFQNPWRRDPKFKVTPFFNRKVVVHIEKWINEPDIIILIGPRQSGKTTILYKLIENLISQNISSNAVFFFNCDNLAVRSLFEDIPTFVRFINQMTTASQPIIIIDEVQRLPNPGMFLKELFDLKLNYKIIASGSSSLEIRSKIKEALTGRKILFHIFPLDFSEYLFKNDKFSPLNTTSLDDIAGHFSQFNQIWGEKLKSEWELFLTYGGYPRIQLTDEVEKKKLLLNEIYSSYVQKDISEFLKIENITGFIKLVQLIALTSGQIINKSNLALNAGINHQTLDKFLGILQETFVIESVIPFFTNKLKEIVKNPKLYYFDAGIRNLAIGNFSDPDLRQDQGFLQETFVLRELKSILNINTKLKFWRTKVGAEVDFIIEQGKNIVPIECKSLLKLPTISRSFQNFISLYQPPKGFVLNGNLFDKISFDNSEIYFIPYHWFPFLKKIILSR
ncbi:MAG: ATP-binding protein [candidate division KSB1 bacterium]|nr:ATP-binding protein [candidate division KSB1 bacterium]